MDSLRELAHKLQDSGTRIVITLAIPELLSRCAQLRQAARIDHLIIAEDSRWGYAQKANSAEDTIRLERLIDVVPLAAPIKLDPDVIVVLQYTGGTTGIPKAAALSHANVVAAAEISAHWQTVRTRLRDEADRVLMCLPLFHAFALTMVNRHLGHGNTIFLRQRFDPSTSLDEIERHHISILHGVPTMFIGMLGVPGLAGRDISSLDYATSGGAPLPMEVARDFELRTGVRIYPGWGMSETAAIGCQHIPGGAIRPGSIGMPLPSIELQVVALDDPGRRLPCGEKGEILVRGPNLFSNYWGREAERYRDFIDGCFRTGDVGHIDADGYVFLSDRKKDMILSSGFNVYPCQIEEAIYEHPLVSECVVIGVPDAYRAQVAKTFVSLKPGTGELSLHDLRAFLASRVGRHELPQELEIRQHLPRQRRKTIKACPSAGRGGPSCR